MKTYVKYCLLFAVSVMFFSCNNDEVENSNFTFTGTVIDTISKELMPELPIVVTDGNNIYTSTKTNSDGRFILSVNINKITSAYYILIGDNSCIKKRVEIHGFAGDETDLGIIEIVGPSIPVVRLDEHKTDNGIITCDAVVISNGRLEITEKGFCFGKTAQPTIDDEKIVCGSGDGSFQGEITITDLDVSSTYFIRPYAINSKGAGYGEEFSIGTESGLPDVKTGYSFYSDVYGNLGATSVEMRGCLNDNGGYEVFERGFCWDLEGKPSIESNKKFIGGDELGNYSIIVDGLLPNTQYYFRAYAKNKNGISYGDIRTFTTLDGSPTVETMQVKYGTTMLECYGKVSTDSGFPIIRRGVCYSTHSMPTLDDNVVLSSSNDIGEYGVTIDNLEEGTTYYVRAFAENENGVSYGDIISATTLVTTIFRVVDTENSPIPHAIIYFGSTTNKYVCDNNGQLQLTSSVGTWKTFWAIAEGYNESERFRDKPISKNHKEYTIVLTLIPISISPKEFNYSCVREEQFGLKTVSTLTIVNHSKVSKEFSFRNIPDGINLSINKGSLAAKEALNIDITFTNPGPSIPNSFKYNVLWDGNNKPVQWLWIYNWDDISSTSSNVGIGGGMHYYVKCSHTMELLIDSVVYDIPISFDTSVNIRNNQ